MRFGKNRICVRSDSTRVVERLNADIDEHFQFGEGNHVGRYNSANYYRKYESSGCQEIIKLVNQLMCVSIQKVEKTDKNYHRARKLAHEGNIQLSCQQWSASGLDCFRIKFWQSRPGILIPCRRLIVGSC